MKLLLAIVDERFQAELEALLLASGAPGYSVVPRVTGTGVSGPKLGSGAYPHTSSIVLSVLDDGHAEALAERVRAHCRDCGERAHLLTLDVTQLS